MDCIPRDTCSSPSLMEMVTFLIGVADEISNLILYLFSCAYVVSAVGVIQLMTGIVVVTSLLGSLKSTSNSLVRAATFCACASMRTNKATKTKATKTTNCFFIMGLPRLYRDVYLVKRILLLYTSCVSPVTTVIRTE